MTYKSTCFKALALLVFISTSMFSYSQTTNTNVVFSGVFGGTSIDGNTYLYPTGSEGWAGFANEDVSLYPLSFSDDGEISFTGATAGTDTDVYFRFEYNPYPDTEPSFSTVAVTVSGTAETSYSVDIPSQGANTFSSFLLYLTTLDSPVTLTNVTVTSSGIADPCADITCAEGLVCDNGECVEVAPSALTITTTVCDAASSVQMTGPWWGWDPNGGPAASDNGDGSWTFTFDPAPADNMEYLLVVDGVQEDLVASNTASEDWSCTPVTDYWSYANRQWVVGSGDVSNVYGQCGACEVGPSTLTITTTVCDAASSVQMTGPWWGWDPAAGPAASDNGDGSWTFTFDPAPTDNMEYLLVVDGVQEDLVASSTASEDWSCTPVTDYWSYANRQWAVGSGDVSNVYGTCGACEVAPSTLTITTTVCDAATSVAMTGPWWGWDPAAGPAASDNGDGSWTFTFDPAPTDNMEYLLVVDGVQEDLVASSTASEDWSCTPLTDYWSYANRQWAVGSGDVSNVYGTCGSCEVESTTATIEFVVDMNGVDQPSADYDNVVVNGSWNGWAGWGVTLSDEDADGVYTGSLEIEQGTTFEYVVAVTGPADGYSGWGMQWGDGCGNANVFATAGEAGSVTTSTLTPGCSEVLGCVDLNASNYDANATAQAYDQYGNLGCIYASCDDIPAWGCIYGDGFGFFNAEFGADLCVTYGGTPCEEPVAVLGCMYANADNYNALANDDDGSCLFPADCLGDLDGDLLAGTSDLLLLLSGFGNVCE